MLKPREAAQRDICEELAVLTLKRAFRVTAMDANRSRWTADFALVFVEKTNFLLRKTIETGGTPEGYFRH